MEWVEQFFFKSNAHLSPLQYLKICRELLCRTLQTFILLNVVCYDLSIQYFVLVHVDYRIRVHKRSTGSNWYWSYSLKHKFLLETISAGVLRFS